MGVIEVVKTLFIIAVLGTLVAPLLSWVERLAQARPRIGWSRADRFGLGQLVPLHPLEDLIRVVTRADFLPESRKRLQRWATPALMAGGALLGFAVIPYGGRYEAWGHSWSLVIADLDYGVLFVLALASVATYGALLAGADGDDGRGRSSSLRLQARLISYQVAVGLSILGVPLVFGSLRLTEIGFAQQETFRLLGLAQHLGWLAEGSTWADAIRLPAWGLFVQPLSFALFFAATTLGGTRALFARFEEESSEMDCGLYRMADALQLVVIAGVMVAIFLGGWSIPWLPDADLIAGLTSLLGGDWANLLAMLLHVIVFFIKLVALILLQVVVRSGLPRLRHQRVMNLGWRILIPLSLLNIVATALGVLAAGELASA
jgi:NADH-quinone oxidoreductase subunit H